MRLAIKGTDISVVVTADRDLSIQEVLSAQQLVTGDFEALFIKENDQEETGSINVQSETNKKSSNKFYEYGEMVSVSVMCPVCGLAQEVKGRYGNKYTKCPECATKLFNSSAGSDGYGSKDDRGNFYHAHDVLKENDPVRNGEISW
ncbi:hypothetical protein [Enterococcus rotai]|uniref:hypothetical protein n=1 Tax=Enterococcus rotai TaxID=118060 RepID=UPI0032B39E6E